MHRCLLHVRHQGRPWLLPPRRPSSSSSLASNDSNKSSSSQLRKTFLDFFSTSPAGPHLIVPSSSVVPHNDPTLSFVNAGMNQFKSVLLGHADPPGPRVANVQKCVRVGGKHNDITAVGADGHHHTFFEMMGNWAFGGPGAYFKREACSMAWQLLTGPYQLPPEKLFVTYFQGCEKLSIPPDLETRDIWLSLGVKDEKILPFGAKENFWEMGAVGPCGPCTEIHYDHGGRGPGGVNRGFDDLVEVWNLVFMEYNRIDDLVLQSLDLKHVDTGMGLERLSAIKCGSTSNYDSDLFRPLMDAIARLTGAPAYEGKFLGADHLDTKYRILADHARMITACIADGMFPETCHRLRNVMRRALRICREDFRSDHRLMIELAHRFGDSVGHHYQEVPRNLHRVKTILEADAELMAQLEAAGKTALAKLVAEYPAIATSDLACAAEATQILDALHFLDKHVGSVGEITGDLAYKMHSSFTLTADHLRELAAVKGVAFNEEDFERVLLQVKRNSKLEGMVHLRDVSKIPRTDSSAVYEFTSSEPGKYVFPLVTGARILGIDRGESSVNKLVAGETGVIYLDRTNFYSESGGQVGDQGELVSDKGALFVVSDCQRVLGSPDHVAHVGVVQLGKFAVGDQLKQLRIDTARRLHLMQNHTATHLLNEALHSLMPLTCQRSSFVGPEYLRHDVSAFQTVIDHKFVTKVEERVHSRISANLPVLREMRSSQELLSAVGSNIISIPGERYPEVVSTITVADGGATEPCCGTHLLSTGDVQSFAIVGVKSTGAGVKSFKCLTGARASAARERGLKLIGAVSDICKEAVKLGDLSSISLLPAEERKLRDLIETIRKKKKLMRDSRHDREIPWSVSTEMFSILDDLLRHLLSYERFANKTSMQEDMEQIIEDKSHLPYITHYFDISKSSKVTLSKITKLSKDKPILLVARTEEGVYARACVPEASVTETFDAEKWVSRVAEHFGNARVFSPRGQDRTLVCNMALVRNCDCVDISVDGALDKAEHFAQVLAQRSRNLG